MIPEQLIKMVLLRSTSIPKADIPGLKVSQQLTTDELRCFAMYKSHLLGYYGLYGYAVKAIEDKDILPSIIYLIKNGPNKIVYKNTPDEIFQTVIQKQMNNKSILIDERF
ncbi:MAG: hypothetical protein EZS28_043952 [Streblomastix strix]|uniref:Uncharacterized protein n=1 Tax=Streblomastix strix TaxID=222440 RepID=A0A5J4TSS2_9EUKA|nr:MAG: hypothetical protein EZS28_043952 [Streblomastix strix]